MKTLIKISVLSIICILLLGTCTWAKAENEFSRVIKKDYDVNPGAQLILNNKFGDVQCVNWEKNNISIEVTVTVTAPKQETADKILNRISVVFNGTADQVEAKTVLEEGKNSGRTQFQIDYLVHMPVTVNLNVTNKFGDVFINEITGKCRIDLGYGNLEAKKLGNGDNLIEVKFGNGDVNWMKGAVLLIKYSTFKLDYAGSLRLDSKFSNLKANKIIALNVTNEGGTLEMENAAVVDCHARFSSVDIQKLEQSLELECQYGSFDIHEVSPDFTSIVIHNKFGDVSVDLDENARYVLDAEMKYCDLDFPESNGKFSFRSQTSSERVYKGTVNGENAIPASKVTVTSEFGNVSIK